MSNHEMSKCWTNFETFVHVCKTTAVIPVTNASDLSIWEDWLLQQVENAVLLNYIHCLSSNAVLLFWQLFAGHFDTSVGPKVESTSYMNIVNYLECRSEDVLFLTDMPRGKTWHYSDFTGAVQFPCLQCFPSIFWCVSQCPCCILIWVRNVWFRVICSLFLGVNCTANGSQSADVPECLLNKPFQCPYCVKDIWFVCVRLY
jgi:hypothetical protein